MRRRICCSVPHAVSSHLLKSIPRTAALSSAYKQRGVSSVQCGCTWVEEVRCWAGLRRRQRRQFPLQRWLCVGVFLCSPTVELLLCQAAFCACAVQSLCSDRGTQRDVFLKSHTHTYCCSAPLMCKSNSERLICPPCFVNQVVVGAKAEITIYI